MKTDSSIDTYLHETREFAPAAAFISKANVNLAKYEELVEAGKNDFVKFWEEEAKKIVWRETWHTPLEWNEPYAKWFVGGKLNVTESCLDRHLQTKIKNKIAIVWESESGDIRRFTYEQLHTEVCKLAAVLERNGIKAKDRVAIYMPLIPEAVIAMLACARIGAAHSVIFGGFSAESIRDRVNDAGCVMIITADGGMRNNKTILLKNNVDEALKDNACPSVVTVLVYHHVGNKVTMEINRDVWWHEEIKKNSELDLAKSPESFDAENPLFILYTSGTTGKPKGILHTSGGYLTQVAATTSWVFDLKDEDIYWCTADVGWITGHSYVVYGPLAQGATVFLYEGAPLYPEPDRFWQMTAKHKISILYTAPTAIRTFMKMGDEHVLKHDLSSLRLLGTVGEPINPEAWIWYHNLIGKGRCPIVDTWWQTETGAIMIAPMPGAVTTVPGSATKSLPGISMYVVNQDGESCNSESGGYLVAKQPWPSMMRGIWNDPERFKETYWSQIPKMYFAGDGARKDENDNFWIMGRIDDVVNVSGHRIGTMEVESALVSNTHVAEAAVVARPDEITGQAIVAFVTLKNEAVASEEIKQELYAVVAKQIGSFAKPAS
ncbi:MAG: acetate--CoA ligase, partial [bacterium]|nr:acetate--CoA ligase [bacterium]